MFRRARLRSIVCRVCQNIQPDIGIGQEHAGERGSFVCDDSIMKLSYHVFDGSLLCAVLVDCIGVSQGRCRPLSDSRQGQKDKSTRRKVTQPSRGYLGPCTWWVPNRPGRDFMVDADTCGYADDDYERTAERTCCGKLSGNGMDTIHHSSCYASRQGANHYDPHVRIKVQFVC